MIDTRRVRDFTDRESAYQFAAAKVALMLAEATSMPVPLALSGGSSPVRLFELLTRPPHSRKIPWDRLAICWVDERMVPSDHALSNFGLAKQWLLDRVPEPVARIFPMHTDYPSTAAAAQAYEQTLRGLFPGQDFPRFDLILLGMGPDGHIASLFPGDPALEDTSRWVVAVSAPKMPPHVPRLTLTLPVLNRAKQIIVLVPGAGKQDAFMDASENPSSGLPAALLHPQGEISWLTCFCE
ncbi:MAG TPA: 6-phosphogluconolactonase [Desulfonatronum sp.]|nr:6-phosphogluconolactonase [Desulfonatronum sp.]